MLATPWISRHSVMVDIETLGTDPSTSPMIQLGAVRFNAKCQVEGVFLASLHPVGPIDPNTLKWWLETNPTLLAQILEKAGDVRTVLYDFLQWIPQETWLWAAPSTFDASFVTRYVREYFPGSQQLSRRRVVDSRSFLLGAGKDERDRVDLKEHAGEFSRFLTHPYPTDVTPETWTGHNALHDALAQVFYIKHLLGL